MAPVASPGPKVSIHVPAYAEPPTMLIATLDALAQLDYPDFEVLVVDNNTRDESLWRPVQAHCRKLGPRFRFFHVDPLPGYKAGALNFALDQTAADAEVVAAIDADYVVRPEWLRDLVPAFANPRTGIWVTTQAETSPSTESPSQADGVLVAYGDPKPQHGVLGKWKYAADYDVFFGVINPLDGNVWVYKPRGWSPAGN